MSTAASSTEPSQSPGPRRGRQLGAAVLVVLACVSLVAGTLGIWARRNFLDSDRFTARAAAAIADPAVQEAVALRLTDQLMTIVDPRTLFEQALPERGQLLAVPLANAVEGFVGDRVRTFVASDRFARLWAGAVQIAHRTAVDVLRGRKGAVTIDNGQVTLDLLPVVNAVLAQITSSSPEILGHEINLPDITLDEVPAAAITRLEDALGVNLGDDFGQLVIYDDKQLAAAQDAVALLDRIATPLLVLGLVLAGAAVRVSHRRRRTVLQLAGGLAVGMVLVRRLAWRLRDEIAGIPPTHEGQAAVSAVLDQFLGPLTTFALDIICALLAVVAVALITADTPRAAAFRTRATALWRRAEEEPAGAWVRAHRGAVLGAGAALGVVVLWVADITWFGLLLLIAFGAVFAAVVQRVGTSPAPE